MPSVLRSLSILALALTSSAPLAFAHDGDPKLLDKQPAYQGHGWRNA